MEYILAHDVGTSGDKAVLVDLKGKIITKAFEPYPIYYPQPLWAEQNPSDWWHAIGKTSRQVVELSGIEPRQIIGLAFSTQMINAIPMDAENNPLMPCISWLDGRAYAEAKMIMGRFGGPAIFNAVLGAVITGKDLLPKYIWLKKHMPDVYKKSAAIVDAGSYILHQATGRLVYEWSTASVTGVFNLKSKKWDETIIRFFGLDKTKFPELIRSFDKVGDLTAQAASELGILQGTPVFGGAGDAMTAAVGSGAVGEGDGYLCLGTSGFVVVVTEKRIVGKKGFAPLQSADPKKLILIGEMETAAACLKWAARELYGPEPDAEVYKRMDEEVDQTPPGAGGLLFAPWMYGERCPIPDESIRASFINLGTNHTRSQMARAIYEGVGYNFQWILELMESLYNLYPDPLRVTGGGAKGLPWLKVIADITGHKLESLPDPQEVSAVGAALIAAIGLGIYPSFEAIKPLIEIGQSVSPDPTHKEIYNRYYKSYREIYPALRKLYHQMNREIEK